MNIAVGSGAWNNESRNNWTPKRIEKLRALAFEEYTSGQIAEMLGGVSRSAVVAKCKRLGFQLSWRKLGLPFDMSASAPHLGNPATALKRHARHATPGDASSKSGARPGITLAPTATQRTNDTLADLFRVGTDDTVIFGQRHVNLQHGETHRDVSAADRANCFAEKPDGVRLIDLRPFHCRWPTGSDEAFRFCGSARTGAGPYCSQHAAIAGGVNPTRDSKGERARCR